MNRNFLVGCLISMAQLGFEGDGSPVVEAGDEFSSDNNQRRIVLRLDSTAYPVMGAIMSHVVYENPTPKPWMLFRPETSVGVTIRSTPTEWETDPFYGHKGGMGFVLGKFRTSTRKLPDGAEISETYAPDLEEMVIPPMSRHAFTVRYSHGREDLLFAGGRNLVVTDNHVKLTSNVFKFWMVMARESVDALLVDVANPQLDQPERNFRAEWLERLRPDLRLQMRYGDATGEKRAAMEAERQKTIGEFKTWWTAGRDTPEMRKFLEEFNVNEGVPLEIVRELESRPPAPKVSSAKDPLDKTSEAPSPVKTGPPVPDLDASTASAPAVPPVPASTNNSSGISWLAAVGLLALLLALGWRRLRRAPTQ